MSTVLKHATLGVIAIIHIKHIKLIFLLALVTVSALSCGNDSPTEPEERRSSCNTAFNPNAFPAATISFKADILPIFEKNGCGSIFCHGSTTPQSGYSPFTAVGALGPGNEAKQLGTCNVIRGNPDESYLIKKLTGAPGIIGNRMPEGGDPIDTADLLKIRQWITEGARDN
ncbi:hypothetical protein HYR99_02715 [Candidatus Poribacteria bacterium]|nr:hypothetical protein [Candidatus Poribacteria bacterium]